MNEGRINQQPESIEMKTDEKMKNYYIVKDDKFREIKLSRDDVLQEAAMILHNDHQFPDSRGKEYDYLRAKRAIRDALKEHGAATYFGGNLEAQISSDAYIVLDLFKNK
ncbi:MAG: hypothetical protein PHU42_02025 [Patescibacteria group bacterium]|nr:hypothetical protein [Patescibacteria group bacterium]